MTPQLSLKFASVAFAIMWTAGMLWLSPLSGIAGAVIMVAAGALVGILWYFAMRWFMNRYLVRKQ